MIVSKNYAKSKNLEVHMYFTNKGYKGGLCVITPNFNINPNEIYSNHINFMTSGLEFNLPKIKKDEQKREVFYIAGASGVGKTYMCGKIAKAYKKLYPKNKLVFISTINDNPVIKSLKPIYINIIDKRKVAYNLLNPETKIRVVNNPEDDTAKQTSDFQNSIVMFDDLEGADKTVNKVIVNEVLDPMLSVGRHFNISLILCKHLLLDYKNTRNILVEMTYLCIYPSQARRQIRNVLEKYLGLEKNQIHKIMNVTDRWVMIHTKYPNFCFTDTSLWII